MFKIIVYILNIFDKIYQKKIIKKLNLIFNKNIDIIFDVGAHKGEFVKLIISNFNSKKIYSFEPSGTFNKLKENIKKMNLTENQIHLNNFALGEMDEKREFKQMKESSSSTLSDIDTSSKYFKRKNLILNFGFNTKIFDKTVVRVKDGFTYLKEEKIKKVDLLKIDTEGYEYFVIKGFGKNIDKVKVVFFEHHYDLMLVKNYTFSKIHDYLVANDFKKHSRFKMPFRKTFEYIYINKKYF